MRKGGGGKTFYWQLPNQMCYLCSLTLPWSTSWRQGKGRHLRVEATALESVAGFEFQVTLLTADVDSGNGFT